MINEPTAKHDIFICIPKDDPIDKGESNLDIRI